MKQAEYRITNEEELIYTVLNSTAQILLANLPIAVYFTSPDGGNLDFENGGYSFYLTTVFPWDESAVRASLSPLSADSIGSAFFDPLGETCAGFENITIIFQRASLWCPLSL